MSPKFAAILCFDQVEIYTLFLLYKEFILHANRTATLKLAKFKEYILGINPKRG